jgi:DNA-binding MurR/RpiR family transcriptional regulator
MTTRVLDKVALIIERAPAARRTVLALVLEDPQRVLDETFEMLAQRAGSSVPTIMRTCRDLGFAGLREFKLALAQDLAVGGSPLNRRVRADDDAEQVIAKITHVGGMPSVLQAVDVARERGATIIALTQGGSPLARRAHILLGIEVAPDPVMPVGPEAYLAHLTVIEILTVLVAQRLGHKAEHRLAGIQRALETRGVDMQHHPRLDWDAPAAGEPQPSRRKRSR